MSGIDTFSSPRSSLATNYNPEHGCCMKDAFFSSITQPASIQSNRNRATLVTNQDSQHGRHLSLVSKSRKSLTSILEPEHFRASSMTRLSSKQGQSPKPQQKKHTVSQILKAKPVMQIVNRPALHSSVTGHLVHPRAQVRPQLPHRQSNKQLLSLNAIKASKIHIKSLIIQKPSSVIKASCQLGLPHTNSGFKASFAKSLASTRHFAHQPSSAFFYSSAQPLTDRSQPLVTKLNYRTINRVDDGTAQTSSIANDLESCYPLFLHRSVASISESPEVSNTSKVIFKVSAMEPGQPLLPQDLRRGVSFVNRNSSKTPAQGRVMTFADNDVPQEIQKQNRLSVILNSFKKLVHFEEYFARGGFVGGGRISSVYRVQETATRQLLCSKEVFKKLIYEKDVGAEIDNQILVHYKLPLHRNVISLYGTFEDYKRYYFIEELAENNVRSLMKDKMPEELALECARDILNGLLFLHRHGIVHRHLKPENIMTSMGTCKIGDFGWKGKLLSLNGHHPDIDYSSPELSTNQGFDEKTDCWSLGIIVFEMLVGQLPAPFSCQLFQRNRQKISSLSAKTQELLEGLLQHDKDQRVGVSRALELIDLPPEKVNLELIQEMIS